MGLEARQQDTSLSARFTGLEAGKQANRPRGLLRTVGLGRPSRAKGPIYVLGRGPRGPLPRSVLGAAR